MFLITMPRVVPEQRAKFENDELFRKLSRPSETFVTSGTNLYLKMLSVSEGASETGSNTHQYIDFDREPGRVHICSRFIFNGVCVRWHGWIDLMRLDGVGYLEFDAEMARIEDDILKQSVEQASLRLQELQHRRESFQHQHSDYIHDSSLGDSAMPSREESCNNSLSSEPSSIEDIHVQSTVRNS